MLENSTCEDYKVKHMRLTKASRGEGGGKSQSALLLDLALASRLASWLGCLGCLCWLGWWGCMC